MVSVPDLARSLPRPSPPTDSPVRELQPHVMSVSLHVVQLLAQERSADVLSQGSHPGRARHSFPKLVCLSGEKWDWGAGGERGRDFWAPGRE